MNNAIDLTKCLQDARAAALIAWREIHHFYRGEFDVFEKPDGPATEADIKADKTILAYLRERYPTNEFGYLSEEVAKDDSRLDKTYCWIIDPIDGTKDFIAGKLDFAIQIALAGPVVPDGPCIPLIGVVYQPPAGSMMTACYGEGAFEEIIPEESVINSADVPGYGDRNKISVTSHSDPSAIRAVVTKQNPTGKLQKIVDHLGITEISNRGSFGVKVGEVATGREDLYLNTAHRRCKEWDVCAPHMILTEAGGMLTDLRGRQITYNKEDVFVDCGIVASNSHLHASVLDRLSQIEDVWG